jgi:hypothetical protein
MLIRIYILSKSGPVLTQNEEPDLQEKKVIRIEAGATYYEKTYSKHYREHRDPPSPLPLTGFRVLYRELLRPDQESYLEFLEELSVDSLEGPVLRTRAHPRNLLECCDGVSLAQEPHYLLVQVSVDDRLLRRPYQEQPLQRHLRDRIRQVKGLSGEQAQEVYDQVLAHIRSYFAQVFGGVPR